MTAYAADKVEYICPDFAHGKYVYATLPDGEVNVYTHLGKVLQNHSDLSTQIFQSESGPQKIATRFYDREQSLIGEVVLFRGHLTFQLSGQPEILNCVAKVTTDQGGH
jgi:hypothetical protein